MNPYRDALTRAIDEAAAATGGKFQILDALSGKEAYIQTVQIGDSVCHCGRPGAKPRKWNTPKGLARGYFCDDCEVALDLARRYLKAKLYTKAGQALERVAS